MNAVPDWRNGRGYPSPAASARRWSWEFLRRNPEYQADWRRYVEAVRKVVKRRPCLAKAADKLLENWTYLGRADDEDPHAIALAADPGMQYFNPPKRALETVSAWEMRTGGIGDKRPLDMALGLRWGLKMGLLNPDAASMRFELAGVAVTTLDPFWDKDRYIAEHELVLLVDLSLPHEPVMQKIDAELRQRRKFLKTRPLNARLRPDKYVEYLRILDADAAGASNQQICLALWPSLTNTPQRLDKARKVARALRDEDYQVLSFLETAARKRKVAR